MAADTPSEVARLKVATFNTSLFRNSLGDLQRDLSTSEDPQARKVAEVIQYVRPDVILLNEFDYDADQVAIQGFVSNYLNVAQGDAEAIDYPHMFVFASNTGVHSGLDLDNSGAVVSTPGSRDYGGDAYGFGTFEGQYGFAVLSKYPAAEGIRTFQNFLWADMPQNLIPQDWYDATEQAALRLSSKNHVDLPLEVAGRTVHILASHPTPPSFDGPEDRNGKRNHDEVRFWADYVEGADYMADDAGLAGGLAEDAIFVVVGDLNLDPVDGDALPAAMDRLLGSAKTVDPKPTSEGATQAAQAQGQANDNHRGDAALDTADFSESVGNLRVDYAIPSSNVAVIESGVLWPTTDSAIADLADASDHHLVWVEFSLP